MQRQPHCHRRCYVPPGDPKAWSSLFADSGTLVGFGSARSQALHGGGGGRHGIGQAPQTEWAYAVTPAPQSPTKIAAAGVDQMKDIKGSRKRRERDIFDNGPSKRSPASAAKERKKKATAQV